MLHVILHGLAVRATVFYGHNRSLCGNQCCLNCDTFTANDTEIVLGIHHHFIQNHRTDFASHIMNGSFLEHFISHADFRRVSRIWIDNKHTRRGIDAPVNHILNFAVENLSFWFGTLVVPDITFSKTSIPKTIKNILHSRIGKYQGCLVRFHRRNHIFILFCNIYHFNMFKINCSILCIILQP